MLYFSTKWYKQDLKGLTTLNQSNIVELKFTGGGISPTKLTPKEVASMLVAFDDALRPLLAQMYPEVNFGDNYVGLVNVGNRSLSLRYRLKEHPDKLRKGFEHLASSVAHNLIDDLPLPSANAAKKIARFATKTESTAQLGYYHEQEDTFDLVADFAPYKKTSFKRVRTNKVLYGKLIKLGDDKSPRAHIRLINGSVISSNIEPSQVLKYRDLLWENVKIMGEALISGQTLKITSFKIDSMVKHDLLPLGETVASIRKILKK